MKKCLILLCLCLLLCGCAPRLRTLDAGQICAELDAAFPPPESITLSFEECCDAYALPGDQVLSAAGHIPFNRLDYAALAVFCMADEKAAREAEQACTARADQVIRLGSYVLAVSGEEAGAIAEAFETLVKIT